MVKDFHKQLRNIAVFGLGVCCMLTVNAAPAKKSGTLREAINTAVNKNPELKATIHSLLARYSQITESRSGFFPKLDVTYSVGHEQSNTPSTRQAEDHWRELNTRSTKASVNQLLFDAGNTYNRYAEAKQNFKTARYELFNVRQAVILDTIKGYLELRRLREVVRVQRTSLGVYSTILENVKRKYKAGIGRISDVYLAESEINRTKASLAQLDRDMKVARYNYLRVVGEYPKASLAPVNKSKLWLPKSLSQAEQLAIKTNPALLGSRAQVAATDYAAQAAKGLFFPQVNGILEADRDLNQEGVVGANSNNEARVEVTYNLFNGGAELANYHIARQNSVRQYNLLRDTERRVLFNVRSDWTTIDTIKKRLVILKEVARQSELTSDGYEKQFKVGRRDLLDLLNVKTDQYGSQINLINENYEYLNTIFDFYSSIGILEKQVLKPRFVLK